MAKSYRKFIAGAATAAVVGSAFAGVAGAASFDDVDSSTTHRDAILALVDAGIIKGYEDGTFRPYAQITRGEAAILTARALGLLDGKNIPANPFKDVSENQAAYEAIVKLADKGIVSGFTKDTFKPYETITRAQVAKYVALAYGYEPADGITKFPDVNKNAALAPYVDVLADAGIIEGKANGNFGYNDALRRADFSGIVKRAIDAAATPTLPSILTVTGDDQGNELTNGSAKTYKVKLVSPVSGKPVAGAELNVTFEENLDTDFGPQRKATITNADGRSVIPYQSKDGNEEEAVITTDKNGIATFTVTGTNTTVTPIVFLDGSFQKWDLEGDQLPPTQDGRFDIETELYVKAEPVTFGVTEYAITVEGKGGNYAAVAERQGQTIYHNGREYTITVNKPDGTPFAGGTVNVGIDELLDGKLGNEPTGAYLVYKDNNVGTQIQVTLDSKGQAKFKLASTDKNDSAKPVVWIDQNLDNNAQTGVLEEGEPVSDRTKVAPTNFQGAYVDGARIQVRDLTGDARNAFGGRDNPYWQNVEDVKGFNFQFLNQSGVPYLPDAFGRDWRSDARITFEIVNTGTHPVRIHTNNLLGDSVLRDAVGAQFLDGTGESARVVQIEVGGRATIAGNVRDADFYELNSALIAAYSVNGNSSVSVKATAVVDKLTGEENQSVSVSAGPVTANLYNTSQAPKVVAVEEKDINNNGSIDQIVLTFDKEVENFEAGDFRLFTGTTDINEPANSAVYGTKDDDINKEDKKKIVLTVEEFPGLGKGLLSFVGLTELHYDPNFSGTKAITDEFGNEAHAFIVSDANGDGVYEFRER